MVLLSSLAEDGKKSTSNRMFFLLGYFDACKAHSRNFYRRLMGTDMRFMVLVGIGVCGLLAACGTTPPPDYSGSWKPLNTYTTNVQELPLARPYRFYALPIDTTLKGLLERWATDSGARLDYRHTSDFSLSPEVRNIQQAQLNDAVAMLDAVYVAYGVSIQMSGDRQIIVTAVPPVKPDENSSKKTRPQSRGK